MKKILLSLTSLTVITLPTLSIISCKTDLEEPVYFIPKEQPKTLFELENDIANFIDIYEEYFYKSSSEWQNYMFENNISINDPNLNEKKIEFKLNSEIAQKNIISSFWLFTVYRYKTFQFDEKYEKKITSPNNISYTILGENKDTFINNYKEELLRDSLTNQTKEHIEKIYEWGIQDNPNANS